ncbi:MAG: hypothetical protein OEY62_06470 [Acidimicrobiia bacterium]|nr:hypothetical protein [Acidimicrobiia bacterium]
MFECVVFIDRFDGVISVVEESRLGEYAEETAAIETARAHRAGFVPSIDSEYAWWVVRRCGDMLARWIADSRSTREFVLDIRSGQLVEA